MAVSKIKGKDCAANIRLYIVDLVRKYSITLLLYRLVLNIMLKEQSH